jgi:hypothetical protein
MIRRLLGVTDRGGMAPGAQKPQQAAPAAAGVRVYAVEGLPGALPLGVSPGLAAAPLALADPSDARAAAAALAAARDAASTAAGGAAAPGPPPLEAALVPAAAGGGQLAAVRALRALAPPMFIIAWCGGGGQGGGGGAGGWESSALLRRAARPLACVGPGSECCEAGRQRQRPAPTNAA